MANLIEARGVRKSFDIPDARSATVRDSIFNLFKQVPRRRYTVLDGVDLEVRRGETIGIMGRNGCGKSTLLKIIAGVYSPDEGEVRLHAPVTAVLELGLGWNPELDAIDNILLLGTVMGLSLADARASLDEILAFAELERFAHLEVKHYSSGMAARLAYAVAFRAAREILILDEILAVGDAGFRAKCFEHYKQLRQRGHTVIMVSHDPNIVINHCDRAVLLDQGRVSFEGPGAEVVKRYMEATGAVPKPAQ